MNLKTKVGLVILFILSVFIASAAFGAGLIDVSSGAGETPIENPGDDSNKLLGFDKADFPRGIDKNRIIKSVVVDEHQKKLTTSAFTLRLTQTKNVAGEIETEKTIFKKSDDRVTMEKKINGETKVRRYSDLNKEIVYTEIVSQGENRYTFEKNKVLVPSNSPEILSLFEAGNFRPIDAESESDGVVVTLNANRLQKSSEAEETFVIDNVSKINASVTVGPNQVVRHVDASFLAQENEDSINYQYEATVSALNGTIVNKPTWLSNVQGIEYTPNYGLIPDRNAIAFSHDSSNPIPPSAVLTLSVSQGGTFKEYRSNLGSYLTENDKIYLTLVNDELEITKNQRPSRDVAKLDSTLYYVELKSADDSTTFFEFAIYP